MRPVSSSFLRTVRNSHGIAVRATIPAGFSIGVAPGGEQIAVVDGDVTLDSTAQVLGTLSLTTDGNGWSTKPGKHPVQPYGTELFIERGVVVNGAIEWCSLGYFKITEVEQDDAPNGNLSVSASDRMQTVVESQMIYPVQFLSTNTVADVFNRCIGDIYPQAVIEFDWDAASDELGTTLITQQDRYETLNDLCLSRGKIMYFDYRGVLIVKTQPLEAGPPVFDVTGGPGGVIVSGSRTLTRDGVFNAVVVTSDGADTTQAPLAVVYDNNPESPTFFHGPYGQVPEFYSSPSVVTNQQAQATATTMLSKAVQLPFQTDFTAVPNPALEPYDIVRVNYGDRSDDELHIIDSLTIPLDASTALSGTGHDPHAVVIAVDGV